MKQLVEFEETNETFYRRLTSCWNVFKKLTRRKMDLSVRYNREINKWIITIYDVS